MQVVRCLMLGFAGPVSGNYAQVSYSVTSGENFSFPILVLFLLFVTFFLVFFLFNSSFLLFFGGSYPPMGLERWGWGVLRGLVCSFVGGGSALIRGLACSFLGGVGCGGDFGVWFTALILMTLQSCTST